MSKKLDDAGDAVGLVVLIFGLVCLALIVALGLSRMR